MTKRRLGPGWFSRLLASPGPDLVKLARDAWLLLRLTAENASRNGIGITASALAFVTMLSLVPLLAALLFIGTRAFSQYESRVLRFLADLLPYSEAALEAQIQAFLVQAESVKGIGVISFVFSVLVAFTAVEWVINRAWGVSRHRPFRQRLQSVTLLLFWGSLLLGGVLSVIVDLASGRGAGRLLGSVSVLGLFPPLTLLVGLTMLYWQVPNTRVGLRFALLGGATSTLLLEILRQGFSIYVHAFPGFQVVYGSLAFVLFFMISIQLSWLIVLAGNHLTYVSQHFEVLALRDRAAKLLRGPWLALATLVLLANRQERGEPLVPVAEIAIHLQRVPNELRQALEPVLRAGLVKEAGPALESFVLGRGPRQLGVDEIFACYDPQPFFSTEDLPPSLETLRRRLLELRAEGLAGATVADLATSRAELETSP